MLALVFASMPAHCAGGNFNPPLPGPARRAWLRCVRGACDLALQRPIQMWPVVQGRFRGAGRGRSDAAVALAETRGQNIAHCVTVSRGIRPA